MMISQIFLALENYSYVGDITGFIPDATTPTFFVFRYMKRT